MRRAPAGHEKQVGSLALASRHLWVGLEGVFKLCTPLERLRKFESETSNSFSRPEPFLRYNLGNSLDFMLFKVVLPKTSYSGRRIMGSRIMGSIGYWDQIYPDWPVPNNSFLPNFTLKLICLLLSVGYWNQLVPVPK